METPSTEIPTEIKRVIRFLIDRKEKFTSIIDHFSYGLPDAEKVREPKFFRDPNFVCVQFPSSLSNERLEEELGRCLKKHENELEAYYEFSVKLQQNLSNLKECLSSELDITYRNYRDIATFLNNSIFEHLMLEYIKLLESLQSKMTSDIHNIEYSLVQQVMMSKQYKFVEITPDKERRLKSDFLEAYKSLYFEIDDLNMCNFIGSFLSMLGVLPSIVLGRRLTRWDFCRIMNRDIVKKHISLKKFLEEFCGIKKSDRLRDISQRINQANKRGQIELPEPTDTKTKGSVKIFYYEPEDLYKVWKEFREKVSFIPDLI